MKGPTETAPTSQLRRTFATDGARLPPTLLAQRELLGQVSVDARTAELRERIAAASRLHLIGSLLLRR